MVNYMVYVSTQKRKPVRSQYRIYRSEKSKAPVRYPFRILAIFLFIGIVIELITLMQLPNYSDEVEKARHDYLIAQAENLQLSKDLDLALQQETVEESAREQGMTYYGETIYIPIVENSATGESVSNP